MKPVAKVELTDEASTKQVGPLVDRFNEITEVPILQGRLLENITITENTTNKIRHGLERKLRGWIVVRSPISPNVFSDSQVSNQKEDQELWLTAETPSGSTDYKISLWVF